MRLFNRRIGIYFMHCPLLVSVTKSNLKKFINVCMCVCFFFVYVRMHAFHPLIVKHSCVSEKRYINYYYYILKTLLRCSSLR